MAEEAAGDTPQTVHPDLIDTDKAIGAVLETPTSGLSAAELIDRAALIEGCRNRLDAALTTTLTAAQTAAATAPHPHPVPAVDVAAASHTDPAPLRKLIRVGRWLQDFAQFRAAFETGVLSQAHIEELKKRANDRTQHQLRESQQLLIDTAQHLDWKDFLKALAYWENAADPDGAKPDITPQRTGVSMKEHADGSVTGKFRLDPLTGQAFKTAFNTEIERLRRETTTTQPESKETPETESSKLSAYQLRAVALLNLIQRGHNNPTGRPSAPIINLILGHTLAQNLLERLNDPSVEPVEPSMTDPNCRCEYADGTPATTRDATMLLAIGRIRAITLDKHHNVQTITSRARTFPQWMKNLLLIQTRGRCQTPGCDAPYTWLQADHIQPASRNGPTNLPNGAILCGQHNHLKSNHHTDNQTGD